MKRLAFVAALGLALCGCATEKVSAPVAPPPPPAAPPPPPLTLQMPVQPGPWRITKTAWTDADEEGFGKFVRAIAESGCTTTITCIKGAGNPYHDSDPPTFLFQADCAKWVYMLRAYYASKNGLPFSYVSKINFYSRDPRFGETSNQVLSRRDLVDTGTGIDAPSALQLLHNEVSSATYRMDPGDAASMLQDFYSPKIQPGSIRAGTAIYDINGHVMMVYDVTPDGSVLYMDANPDLSVSRGVYGPQVPETTTALGGGFKNFRPMKLEGATQRPDGTYVGGHVVLAANDQIPDYSLEQYRGNVAGTTGDGPNAQFRYNNASLNFYEYARASLSKGGFAFNPVYELQVSMGSLCNDAKEDTREAKDRVKAGFATLYGDLSKDVASWKERDHRVVYHGLSLRDTLAQTYAEQDQACAIASSSDGKASPQSPLDRIVRYVPESNVQTLIAEIYEPASFSQMKPVGR